MDIKERQPLRQNTGRQAITLPSVAGLPTVKIEVLFLNFFGEPIVIAGDLLQSIIVK